MPHDGIERRLVALAIRNRYLLALDCVLLPLATWLACVIRFEGNDWPRSIGMAMLAYAVLGTAAKVAVLLKLGLYRRLWRYASVLDMEVLGIAGTAAAAAGMVVGLGLVPLLGAFGGRVPLSVLAIDALLGVAMIAVPRLLVRSLLQRRRRWRRTTSKRAVIVGAGAAGSLIVRELLDNPSLELVPVAFVDDDRAKLGRHLHGVPIAGSLERLAGVAKAYDAVDVIIAMPTAPGQVVRQVVRVATDAGLRTRTVPGMFEVIGGRKSVSALREVKIEDLLRREPVCSDLLRVRQLATEKVVMITGAGGSIGSELCRQIARLRPTRLIAVGRGENSVFELLQELGREHPTLAVEPVIADVRDRARLERIFAQHRPETVFHAAAHKHVPLMEQNVSEAILNNVLGTQVLAELAHRHGAERFVLISSDKAVRPSSVMGATKRLAEGVIQEIGRRSRCRFVSVRFGNVLGSRGSVIPTFLRQIQAGGPLTITHPEMRRYFMTIPEAVQLVLQAGIMGEGGEVFVLDMGEPVRVLDLARDLIRLSGLREGTDVEIRFTGMRPGEKLYEELFFDEENASPTEHPKVLRARNAVLELVGAAESVENLIAAAARNETADELRRRIRILVPEYSGAGVSAPPPAGPLAPTDPAVRERERPEPAALSRAS